VEENPYQAPRSDSQSKGAIDSTIDPWLARGALAHRFGDAVDILRRQLCGANHLQRRNLLGIFSLALFVAGLALIGHAGAGTRPGDRSDEQATGIKNSSVAQFPPLTAGELYGILIYT
jgi:hypothetical protein